MKHATATSSTIIRAYHRCEKRLENDRRLMAASSSAGFVIPYGQKKGCKTGFQVFIKVSRYSEELLKLHPLTGGLHENNK